MPIVTVSTLIDAPIERVFDLALSIDLHADASYPAKAEAVAGVTHGLIGLGEEVTWKARQFGIAQTLTSRIVSLDRPRHFRDAMVKGPFNRFDHDHAFTEEGGKTRIVDRFDFTPPFGILGRIAAALFLAAHMKRLVAAQAQAVKAAAEGDGWKKYLP